MKTYLFTLYVGLFSIKSQAYCTVSHACHNIKGTEYYTLQVELNPSWQQLKLIEFCKDKGIHVTAYSPLGGQFRSRVLQSEVLDEIAKARGKSVAQVSTAFSRCFLINPSSVFHLISRHERLHVY
jgi:diketogulonate reductase-like aldo/keto reductase